MFLGLLPPCANEEITENSRDAARTSGSDAVVALHRERVGGLRM